MAIFNSVSEMDAIKWTGDNLAEVKTFFGPSVWIATCPEFPQALFLANDDPNIRPPVPEARAAVVIAPAYICRGPKVGGVDPKECGYKFFLFSERGEAHIFEAYYSAGRP